MTFDHIELLKFVNCCDYIFSDFCDTLQFTRMPFGMHGALASIPKR